jgi:hypothetical protein
MNPEIATAVGQESLLSKQVGFKLLTGIMMLMFCLLAVETAWGNDTIPALDGRSSRPGRNNPAVEVTPVKVTADTLVDVTTAPRVHSPMKATMLSATLPGLGQIYNGRAWKVPFIYAGYAGVVYALNFNNTNYQRYRRAWIAQIDGNPNTISEFPSISGDRLERATNYYRRNLEVTYIVAAAIYALNILDATVDAHLLDFDVGEQLSMNIKPSIIFAPVGAIPQKAAPGLILSLRF